MIRARGAEAPTKLGPPRVADNRVTREERNTLAYRALLAFCFFYYFRLSDIAPALSYVPLEKIMGGIALVALSAALVQNRGDLKFPPESKLLLLLFLQMCMSIPFAYWKGGAFNTVFTRFSKGVIVALLVMLLVNTNARLRRILFVQAAAMATLTLISVFLNHTVRGRLSGFIGGAFENPNDLAINLALNWPLCLGFFLLARSLSRKGVWALGLITMLYGVSATYSRSGFLAFTVGATVALWVLGVRGRRFGLIVLASLTVVGLLIAVPTHYLGRLKTIVTLQEDVGPDGAFTSGDSLEGRRELLRNSFAAMVHNPLLGVGPGNFPVFSGSWHVAHNTYTQLGAESGLPALFLFIAVLFLAFRNLIRAGELIRATRDHELLIIRDTLLASLAAYLLGAFFTDTAYELYPYLLIGYTSAIYRIASAKTSTVPGTEEMAPKGRGRPIRKRAGFLDAVRRTDQFHSL